MLQPHMSDELEIVIIKIVTVQLFNCFCNLKGSTNKVLDSSEAAASCEQKLGCSATAI